MTGHKYSENVQLLDPALRKVYQDMPAIQVSEEILPKLRDGGLFPVPDLPETVTKELIKERSVQGNLYKPAAFVEGKKYPALLWFHGGGYLFGSPDMGQGLAPKYINEVGLIMFSARYRLAPENKHPSALEDAVAALKYLAALPYVDTSRIAVGGVSAGGGLSACLALEVAENSSLPRISALTLDIPYLSPIASSAGPLFEKIWSVYNTKKAVEWFSPGDLQKDPKAFALNAKSLETFPPTIIGVAEYDVLRDSAIEFATRLLKESANGCELHVWKGTVHGSNGMAPTAPVHMNQQQVYRRFLIDVWADKGNNKL